MCFVHHGRKCSWFHFAYWSVGGNGGRGGSMASEPTNKGGGGICVRHPVNIRLLVMLNRNFENYAQK